MEHNVGAGGAVINKNRILLITNNGKFWGFPKGKIKKGEELIDTARREIYEESGIKEIELIRPLGSYGRHEMTSEGKDNPNVTKTMHMFLFITKQEAIKPIDKNIKESAWMTKEQAIEALYHPKDKEFLRGIIDEIYTIL